ncbi:MAG: putative phage regulatory protein [Bacilli bacterium]|nr:putative phage regulatory protein [Bacilli bacterium]
MRKQKHTLTEFGISVKKALLDRKILQKEFCKYVRIPENRFTEILYGIRPGKRYRELISQELDINEDPLMN